MRSQVALLLGVTLVFGPLGCGPTGGGDDEVIGDGGQRDGSTGPCTDGTKQCEIGTNAWQTCQGGHWVTGVKCPLACDATLGCVECVPGSTACEGQDVVGCSAAGKKGGVIAHCQSTCSSGTCNDPCGQAEVNKSYLGCDYYPTVTMNSQLDTSAAAFSFAVAVAAPNSNAGSATVTITGGGLTTPTTQTVAPGQLQTIKLPWVGALKQDFVSGAQPEKSVLMANGAYHLVSTQPVTVYQFNALEYQVGSSFSYTNDASLLLPRHTWSDSEGKSSYIVMARPTMEIGTGLSKLWSPGLFTVVGSQDGTQVSVKFTANTIAGTGNNPQAFTPGATGTFALNQGTVLMIASGHNDSCNGGTPDANGYSYCDLANGYDLTGTEITADKPVGVFGGHNCDFIPFNKWACDHLEEQLFPLTAWGKHYVGPRAVSTTDPNLWRVVSGDSANLIQFNPPISDKLTNTSIGQVTLDKGKWIEFITDQDFEAQGDTVFMMAGFMVGQNYSNLNPGEGTPGDPAMSLAVPVEQFRKSYTFHAPESYQQNYLTIIAKVGATLMLDGNAITGYTPVGSGDWGVNKLTIQGGTHTITTDGTDGFGIQVYGVGSYTSYMYPGGLDVKEIYVPG
jgi:hypothetical protein